MCFSAATWLSPSRRRALISRREEQAEHLSWLREEKDDGLYHLLLRFKECETAVFKAFGCGPTLVALAGVDLAKVPVLLWRWKVLKGVKVKLGLKIICKRKQRDVQYRGFTACLPEFSDSCNNADHRFQWSVKVAHTGLLTHHVAPHGMKLLACYRPSITVTIHRNDVTKEI